MTAIIFGVSGQDGFYLNILLNQLGIEVYGISRSIKGSLSGSVADRNFVERIIKDNKPNFVFHLAANSTTRHDALFENHASIATGTLNILDACYKHSQSSRIFLSGSAVQFENIGQPINELSPFAPISTYAVSRISSVYAARYYRSLGLKVYVGYFFNHDSPLRTERHVNQKIISAIKRITNGSKELIEIGNLNTRKEFNFAGDVVDAVWKLVNQDKIFEAVIGSGKAYSIQEWVKICFDIAHLDWKDFVVEKKDFIAEYDVLVSDPGLIKSLGWEPKLDIEDLANLMYFKTF